MVMPKSVGLCFVSKSALQSFRYMIVILFCFYWRHYIARLLMFSQQCALYITRVCHWQNTSFQIYSIWSTPLTGEAIPRGQEELPVNTSAPVISLPNLLERVLRCGTVALTSLACVVFLLVCVTVALDKKTTCWKLTLTVGNEKRTQYFQTKNES